MASQVFNLLASLSLDTSNYEKGLSKAGKQANTFASKIGGGIAKAAKIGAAAIAAAATAVAAFGVTADKTGAEFDKSMSQVAATLGYTSDDIKNNIDGAGDAFEALREKAKESGRTTIFSASEAAEGLNILAMSGYSAEQSIAMLDDVLHLAAAGNMDLASAAGYVSGTMKGFNDETKNAAYYADIMAKGATLANTNVSQLGEAMSSGAAGAAAYSQSTESMTVSLLRLAEQGEVGSAAGTALAAAMKNIYTPTNQAKKALDALGVAAYDETGAARDFNDVVNELDAAMADMTEEERAQYKQTIFGIQGLNAYNKMVVTSTQKQNEWADALANATGEANKQYETMTDNLTGDVAAWNSALDGFKIALSDKVTPAIREFVQFGTDSLSKVTEAFEAGDISGAANIVGDFLGEAINKIAEYLPAVVDFAETVILALANALIGNADIIIGAALTIVMDLVQKLLSALPDLVKKIIDALDIIVPQLTAAAAEIIEALVKSLPNLLNAIVQAIPRLIDLILESTETIIPIILDAVIQIILAIVDALPQIIKMLAAQIPKIVKSIVKTLIENLPTILGGIIQLVIGIVAALPEILIPLFELLATIPISIVQGIIEAVPKFISAIGQAATAVWNKIKEVWENIKNWVVNKWNEIWGITKGAEKDLSPEIQTSEMKVGNITAKVDTGAAYGVRENGTIYLQVDGQTFAQGTIPYYLAEQQRRGKGIIVTQGA